MKREDWMASVRNALAGLSRTLRGISDTSSSAAKPKLGVEEGNKLAERSSRNLQHALGFLWENRSYKFGTATTVRSFIDSLARIVSDGLLPPGQSLYRTWVTEFDQALPENIEQEYNNFCEWFFDNVDGDDPVTVAAMTEKRLDGKIHPFADGCGRTAKLLAAFALLRSEFLPVSHRSREEYYQRINESDEEWIRYYTALDAEGREP